MFKLIPTIIGLISDVNKSTDWWKNTPAWTAILTIIAYYLNNKAGYEVIDKGTMEILITFILGIIAMFTGGSFRARPAPVVTPTVNGQITYKDLSE
jgi:hypothetical protein